MPIQRIFFISLAVIISSILGILLVPRFAQASVRISEVAWMGSSNSQYEEWIELYNDGQEPVDLSGWKVLKSGEILLTNLSGSIASNDYYLVCRTTGTLTQPLGGICNLVNPFGGSGLNNTSEQLILTNNQSEVVERIDALSGWPAGESTSKKTMQQQGSSWVTASATPGTILEIVDDTPEPEPSDDNSDTDTSDTPPKNKPILNPTKEHIEKVAADPRYEARMIIPDFATAGVAIPMKATVREQSKSSVVRGRFEWSTGDGGYYAFLKNTPIEHIFYYPGTYTVVMHYYSDIFRTEPDTIHRKTITIVPSDIIILGYSEQEGLRLKNESSKEISLEGWILASQGQEFIFPRYTVITAGNTLALAPQIIGITLDQKSITLMNPSRKLIARYSYLYVQPRVQETSPSYQETSEIILPESPPIVIPPTTIITHSSSRSPGLLTFWHQYRWQLIIGIVSIISILAYLAFHLYAKQDELI